MVQSTKRALFIGLTATFLVTACGGSEQTQTTPTDSSHAEQYVREQADLVSAGLGVAGLRAPRPEATNPMAPTADELRAMAFHTHFNGLSAINIPAGLGAFSDQDLPVVAGTEIMAWHPVNDSGHKARVLLQIPEGFNPQTPCLVVAPASGSRGVYGAVPLVAPWALPKGCAVVYSDKGAGTDYFDVATQTGVQLNGQRVALGTDAANQNTLGFVPELTEQTNAPMNPVAIPHAHSQSNVEAHWGTITLSATDWAKSQLAERFSGLDTESLITLPAGLSNGAQAVLRAVEQDTQERFDAAVAIMPNISPPGVPSLYEYSATAALYQPCLLGDAEFAATLPFANPLLIGFGPVRCQSLAEAGLLDEATPQAALETLTSFGFDPDALMFSASTVVLDVWRTVLVNYASAYLKTPFDQMPCGYGFDASTVSAAQKASWWATGSGSPPGDGITLIDPQMATHPTDPHFAGLKCLHDLIKDDQLQASIAQTKAQAQWSPDVPVFVVHGQVDGLIPAVFSSRPYVEQARENGMPVDYQEIGGAQHFDAFLNALAADPRWQPILPHGWDALDRAWLAVQEKRGLDE